MSLFRLGDRAAAKQAFQQLASAFKRNPHAPPGWAASDEDVIANVKEAEALTGGLIAGP